MVGRSQQRSRWRCHMKVRMSVLLLALIVGAGPSIRSAEGVGSDKGLAARSSLHALNAFAVTARDHSARSIQLLTDEIIDRMCPVDLPQGHSLRVRVFRAE